LPQVKSFSALLLVILAVAGLYLVALGGVDSPLWRSLVRGEPVGLETSLTAAERDSAGLLHAAFDRMDYRLDQVARGRAVPPLFLPAVPPDLAELETIDDKKQVFLRLMLPLILVVNENILTDRRRLDDMLAGRRPRDQDWLVELAVRYGVSPHEPARLLRRLDVVPPSLALAQAVEESGWGTSRFVREANNLFGHVGDDVAAEDQPHGPRMASFASLHEAVRAYVHNLNTHAAYEDLRRARATARMRGASIDGHSLAGTLTRYSERGPAYVEAIRAIIRANGLVRYDRAKLGTSS
jgi:Bax protein